MGPRHSLPAAS